MRVGQFEQLVRQISRAKFLRKTEETTAVSWKQIKKGKRKTGDFEHKAYSSTGILLTRRYPKRNVKQFYTSCSEHLFINIFTSILCESTSSQVHFRVQEKLAI